MPARKKQNLTARDLYKFEIITGLDISPDGRHIMYSLQKVDAKTEKKYSNLWFVPTNGGKPRQFTYGTQVDSSPRWSPDGKQIAFLSNRSEKKQSQMYLIPFSGGEARQLTNLKGVIGSFEWSPDGKQCVCMFKKTDKEVLEREDDEQKKKLGVVSRHITRVFYKSNGTGFLPRERWHIWIINALTGKAKQLTDSETYDETLPSWSPDGKYIAFSSNRTKDPDMDPVMVDLFIMPSKGGKPRKIRTHEGPSLMPTFSPDGRWLAYFGIEGRGPWWRNMCLWVVPADGKGKTRNLTKKFDVQVMGGTSGDLKGYPESSPPTWSCDGKKIYFTMGRHGNTLLKSVACDGTGQSLEDVINDPGVTGSFRFNKDQTRLAYFHADCYDPGQIWVRNMSTGKSRQVTKSNHKLMNSRHLGNVEEVWITGTRGHKIQGWIVTPPKFSKSRKYPAILEIHGGPHVQYGNNFMHEFHLLSSQGYVVFFCNPRGSQGYGENFAKAIWNNWGSVAYQDLMSWADHVAKKSYVDADRMGVTGGSYGGYMTNWIIGHTNRFKAAVTQRCVSNLVTLHGSSDGNWMFQINFGDEPPWENIENYWKQSPLKYIGKAKTPTLVIHSEKDYRTTTDQGEHVFVALKRLKVDTELVLFPDENHDLSRTGRTDRRIERLNHIIRWFDRYLNK